MFSPEELEELRRADAEIERGFSGLTPGERALALELDTAARRLGCTAEQGKKADYYQKKP